MEVKKNKILAYFFLFVGAVVFLFIGFVVASCMVPQQNDITLIDQIVNAKANQYTPIVMALAFVIYETCVFLFIVLRNKKSEKQSCGIEETTVIMGRDEETVIKDEAADQAIEEPDSTTEENKTETSVDDDVSMDEKLFSELFSCNYSFEQISEMMKLGRYMENLTCETLMKMFSVEKTPDEIRQYIDMFYG